jgi:hypothetical protein
MYGVHKVYARYETLGNVHVLPLGRAKNGTLRGNKGEFDRGIYIYRCGPNLLSPCQVGRVVEAARIRTLMLGRSGVRFPAEAFRGVVLF